jgi:hypothetical protein
MSSLIVHKTCLTEVENHNEQLGESGSIYSATYCYTMCPRCKIQVDFNNIIIGYDPNA